MPSFANTPNPTPFGTFDSEVAFRADADKMVVFVKRSLGDDVVSVELTNKMIFAKFEEATQTYGRLINEMRTVSDLSTVLGLPTGSVDLTGVYPRASLEFILRLAEPYASMAGVGGAYDLTTCYFDVELNRQDYDIYTELKIASGSLAGQVYASTLPTGSRGKVRIFDVFHFEPLAAQQFLLNSTNINNFLATNFNYESYTNLNSTLLYVLPVFEDVLRRSMLETAFRVRRSNYSYQIIGSNLRIFPMPVSDMQVGKLFVTVAPATQNPLLDLLSGVSGSLGSAYIDDTLIGISDPSNAPFSDIPYSSITSPGRNWIKQYCLALCTILLGRVRSKFSTVPIPGAELTLDGDALLSQGREDAAKLTDQLREWLLSLTREKMLERDVNMAELLQKQLKYLPSPLGKSIVVG